jgi:methyl-accepting chemotaxis protein
VVADEVRKLAEES